MRNNSENDVNQNGKREHEHAHGQPLTHQPPAVALPDQEKRQGKQGQPNFIPGAAPVGEPEPVKSRKTE
jgi:hypothetical protein